MPFRALGLPEPVTRAVRAAGYTEPTPIQLKGIPHILTGRDLVAAAQTGSGKTAAFVLPILAKLAGGPRRLRALVLVPTRELAAQVEENALAYARYTGLRVTAVYGGVNIAPQERILRGEGVDLLVATPGRLLDLLGRQSLALEDVEILVLDEADRMVDMGFAPDLKRILAQLPEERQTLMFSATMPPELNRVAQAALVNPGRLDMAPPGRPAAAIDQAFYPVAHHLKADLLHELLLRVDDPSAIVFARTKRGADRLAQRLRRLGHSVAAIHGDRNQSQRERALEGFKRGRTAILVATDIASRGIDVDDVSHVINFDVPRAPEDYVHRIGRTGRMDAEGDAFTLVTPEDHKEITAIERTIGRKIPRLRLEGFDYERRRSAQPRAEGRENGGARRNGHARREATGSGAGRNRRRNGSSGNGNGSHARARGERAMRPQETPEGVTRREPARAFGRTPKRILGHAKKRKRL